MPNNRHGTTLPHYEDFLMREHPPFPVRVLLHVNGEPFTLYVPAPTFWDPVEDEEA